MRQGKKSFLRTVKMSKNKLAGILTHWCKHHMAWTSHKPANCLLGKQHKEDQKKKPHKSNSAFIVATAAIAINPLFAVLMTTLANLKQ